MTKKCPVDASEVFGDAETLCSTHIRVLVSVVDDPGPQPAAGTPAADQADPQSSTAGRRQWSRAVCWHCGTTPPVETNNACLRPDCRRSLVPPTLHVRFPGGEVELNPGQRAELGRHGTYGRVFRDFGNVSRRHAVIGVDEDGRAWVEPLHTPNGTFLNETEISEMIGHSLSSGDTVRFALHAVGEVTLYDR